MIAVSWLVFAFLALLWTAGTWVAAAAAHWLADALASGDAAQLARDVAGLPVPEWLGVWMDPASLQALQSALQWALDGAGGLLPLAGATAGWLVPAIWIAWAAGMLLLLVGAAAAHMLLRRLGRRGPGTAQVTGAA